MNARTPTTDWLSRIVETTKDLIARSPYERAVQEIATLGNGRLLQLFAEDRIAHASYEAACAAIKSAENDRIRTLRALEIAARGGHAPNPMQVAA